MSQDGKMNDPSAPPFATRDGKPTTVYTGVPKDLLTDPNGGGTPGGSFDVTKQSRQQPTKPPATTPPATPLANRPQQAGSPAQRVNPQSIPRGGLVPPTPTVQPAGTGSPGVRRPFKV